MMIMMNSVLANDIRNSLQAETNKINWKQFNKCNAYTGDTINVIIGNNDYIVTPIKSYNTVVAFAVILGKYTGLYEVGKYSRTTSKQVSQIHNRIFSNYNRYFIERNW